MNIIMIDSSYPKILINMISDVPIRYFTDIPILLRYVSITDTILYLPSGF